MQTARTAAGWRSRLSGASRAGVQNVPLSLGSGQRSGPAGTAASAVASNAPAATVAGAVEAIKRSPLGLELPPNTPGLALIASSLVRGRDPGAPSPGALSLPRTEVAPPGARTPAAPAPRLARAPALSPPPCPRSRPPPLPCLTPRPPISALPTPGGG
jgi:hypothetical protein